MRYCFNRLKEIHFEITFETSIELVTGFIEKQLKLQHLDVEINSFMMFDKSEVLQDFVYSHKSCKNFKFFKLSYPMNLVWRSDWFVLLSKSSLHTLVLNCFHIEYIGYENSAISKTLRVLQLNETSPKSCKQYNSHIISFIKAFTDLEELRLAFVTAKIMNAVNQYQVKNTSNMYIAKNFIYFETYRININFDIYVLVCLERPSCFSDDE